MYYLDTKVWCTKSALLNQGFRETLEFLQWLLGVLLQMTPVTTKTS